MNVRYNVVTLIFLSKYKLENPFKARLNLTTAAFNDKSAILV